MKKANRLWLQFLAVPAVLLFFMPGSSSALHATEPVNDDNVVYRDVDPAGQTEIYNDNLYVLMQKPMFKASWCILMVTVIVSDAFGSSAMDSWTAGLSSGDKPVADVLYRNGVLRCHGD